MVTEMRGLFFKIIRRLIKFFMIRPEVYGCNLIDPAKPAVFVANHLGSFGPLMLNMFLPFNLITWVTHEITDKRLCPDYLRKDFVEPEMHLRPPLSRLVSIVIGRLCVSIMESIQAIPVYKKSRRLIITFDKTVKNLEEGRQVLIFPEINEDVNDKDHFVEFKRGFVTIAKNLHERSGLAVNFYPVCINKAKNTITISNPTAFDPSQPYRQEKERIVRYLKETILLMLQDQPSSSGGGREAAN